ncbi:nuclear receptor subfamily 2 group E member tailless [Tachypleus tridentatus]|uniref:nuclear receptor subfamily 2 group E member tailless n=1 Tax=Tachypleus tridentatus TaxID=6853 RepID=UPI003FD3665B
MTSSVTTKPPGTSSRILLDIPCKVCHDHSSGKHYGIFACDGCAGFFKRSIRRNRQYVCKARGAGANNCPVDKTHRNQCRACRLRRCLEAGMNKDAVQHERGPRNSTIRRQVAMYFKETAGTELMSTPPFSSHPAFTSLITVASDAPGPTAITTTAPSSFSLRTPPIIHPVPKYPNKLNIGHAFFNNPDVVCESAARILFLNVRWLKTVPAFTGLPIRDQLLLFEEGWRELFLLDAAQFLLPLEVGPLLAAGGLGNEPATSVKVMNLMTEIRSFQEIIAKLKHLNVDPTEYACLKAIVLFKTDFQSGGAEIRGLRDIHMVASLQDQAQMTLGKYVQTAYPSQPFRFGKLLLTLPSLRSVSAKTIEDLFFRKTIGSIPLERLLCDMYKSNDF